MFRVEEDGFYAGAVRHNNLIPSLGCILDSHVNAGAAIASVKLMHRHRQTVCQANTTVAAQTVPINACIGTAGTVIAFKAGCIAKGTTGSFTVDLLKNGSTILSAVITVDGTGSTTSRVLKPGTVSAATVAVGDWLDVVVAVASPTQTGLLVQLDIDETPS